MAGDQIILESNIYDFKEGHLKSESRFLTKDTGRQVAMRRFSIRLYTPRELEKLLHVRRLKLVKLLGDKFSAKSSRMIVVAVKK